MADLELQDLQAQQQSSLVVIHANTDGGMYVTNPGPGAAAVVFRAEGKSVGKIIGRYVPRWAELKGDILKLARRGKTKKPQERGTGHWFMETTNNRCEILAVMEAMLRVKEPQNTHLIVYTDSQWAQNMVLGNWVAKENIDLVTKAREIAKKFANLEIKWVRGHAGDKYNEICDSVATKVCREKPGTPFELKFNVEASLGAILNLIRETKCGGV